MPSKPDTSDNTERNDSNLAAKVAIITSEPSLAQQAQELAEKTQLPLLSPESDQRQHYPFALVLETTIQTPDSPDCYKLGLKPQHSKESDFCIDFAEGQLAHRRQYGGGRKQPLPRAMGLRQGYRPSVIDTTAGLARDAFVLACLGCRVTLFERSPVMHALIANGLIRASLDEHIGETVRNNLHLMPGDAITQLPGIDEQNRDTIYLDPMYPHRNKSALVKKEMRIIRDIVGDDPDTSRLLQTALDTARKRVVVKRPRLAPALSGPEPTTRIESKSTRYDIYIIG